MQDHIAKIAIAILNTVQDFDPTGYRFSNEELAQALEDAGNAVFNINGMIVSDDEMKAAIVKVRAAHERGEC